MRFNIWEGKACANQSYPITQLAPPLYASTVGWRLAANRRVQNLKSANGLPTCRGQCRVVSLKGGRALRLSPPELEIGVDEGFTPERDIFGRKPFAEQLTRIVRRIDGPAVLLLDSPWGTGKTTFVKMWLGELSKADVPNIYFDAFANDYLEDAFLAVAGRSSRRLTN
jgi:KAP family P-loop domain